MSGVQATSECEEAYNRIKMTKDLRHVLFKIENKKEIVVDTQKDKEDIPFAEAWTNFCEALPKNEPRYALVDVEYTTDDGRPQSKLTFVFWSPDGKTTVKDRMLYASSKDAIKQKFKGIMKEVQANDEGDLAWDSINALMNKK